MSSGWTWSLAFARGTTALALLAAGASVTAAAPAPALATVSWRDAALARLRAHDEAAALSEPPAELAADATREDRIAASRGFLALIERTLQSMGEVADAYDAVPVETWRPMDVEVRRRMLMTAIDYWVTYDPARAVAACDQYLSLAAGAPAQEIDAVRRVYLPLALLHAGDFERAGRRLAALEEVLPPESLPEVLIARANALSVTNDTAGARAALDRAKALIPATLEDDDIRHVALGRLESPTKLLGMRLPPTVTIQELDGTAATRVVPLTGRITVLELFTTWCMPCVDSLLELDAIHSGPAFRDVQLLAVAVPSTDGFLPDFRARTTSGERVTVAEGDFASHVQEYRGRLELALPVAILRDDQMRKLTKGPVPLTLLIDSSGRVVLAISGSGATGVVRAAVVALTREEGRPE